MNKLVIGNVDAPEEEKTTEIFLQVQGDGISVMGRVKGEPEEFYLAKFTNDGRFYKNSCVPTRLGFDIDEYGRIIG